MRKNGWYGENYRHSLAARGLSTGKGYNRHRYFADRADMYVGNTMIDFKSDKSGSAAKVPAFETSVTPVEPPKQSALGGFLERLTGRGRQIKPQTTMQRVEGAKELQKRTEDVVRSQRAIEKALDAAEKGQIGEALSLTATKVDPVMGKRLTTDQLDAVKTSLNAYAMKLASAGLPVPDGLKKQLDKSVIERVNIIEKLKSRELHPIREEFRKEAVGFGIAAAESPLLAAEGVGSAIGEGLGAMYGGIGGEEKKFQGLTGQMEDLKKNPFFATNVFVGNEEDGYLRPGWINQMPDNKERVTDRKLTGAFSWAEDGQDGQKNKGAYDFEPIFGKKVNALSEDNSGVFGTNPVTGKREKTYSDEVSKKVDSMFDNRKKIVDVDFSPFKRGNDAFKKGDREGLLKSITELQAEESKLKDRWGFMSQTSAQVKSVQNFEDVFSKDTSSNIIFSGSGGAKKLADQTEKVNKVKAELSDMNNKLYSRRKMLEYRLQRLDATVPPETWTPRDVMRFDEQKKNDFDFMNFNSD